MLDKLSSVSHFQTDIYTKIQYCQEPLTFLTGYLRPTQVDDLHLPHRASDEDACLSLHPFSCAKKINYIILILLILSKYCTLQANMQCKLIRQH